MAGEWTEQTIEDSMAAVIDYRGKTPRKTTTGIPLITAEVVKGGRIATPDEFIAEEDYVAWRWSAAPLPDVIEVNPARQLKKGDVAPYLDMANMPTRGHTPDAAIERAFGSGMRFKNGDTLVARITPCLENGKTAYVDFLQDDQIGWGSVRARQVGDFAALAQYLPVRRARAGGNCCKKCNSSK